MLGSDHRSSAEWIPKDDTVTIQEMLTPSSSSPPKKKSMERLSRLFQKKSKHKKPSLTDPPPEPPSYQSLTRHMSVGSSTHQQYQQLQQQQQRRLQQQQQQRAASSRFNSASKEGGEKLKRFASLRTNTPKTVHELQQELVQGRRLLDQFNAEKEQCLYDNQRSQQEISFLQQRIQERTVATTQLQSQYDTHLSSLRATSDDLSSVRNKLLLLQQNIGELADRLLPHICPDQTCQSLSSFWLNLRQVIEPLCPLSPILIRHLTEKFIMDVLVQNFNLSEIAGCSCSEDYAQIALWFLDHDTTEHHKRIPASTSACSHLSSASNTSASNASSYSFSTPIQLSDAMIFSIRLRQQVASAVVAAQVHREDVKQQLQQVVQGHWKYLYGGLAKAYPYIYQHDTTLEPDVQKHFGAQIQALVEQAVALGFAIKGLELDITAADVQEGVQSLDLSLMDDVEGKSSGIIQFCISPPFKVFNQYEPLVKGKVLCLQ